MSTGRLNRLAGQIGEHLVCAELGRRELIATSFARNVPTFDVLAADESGRTVPIQVKASRSDNWPSQATRWMQLQVDTVTGRQTYAGLTQLTTPDLIWVCVAIAKANSQNHDRFFILTEADIQKVCAHNYTAWMDSIGWKRPRNPASFDCRWSISDIRQFEDKWELIMDRLRMAAPDKSLASVS